LKLAPVVREDDALKRGLFVLAATDNLFEGLESRMCGHEMRKDTGCPVYSNHRADRLEPCMGSGALLSEGIESSNLLRGGNQNICLRGRPALAKGKEVVDLDAVTDPMEPIEPVENPTAERSFFSRFTRLQLGRELRRDEEKSPLSSQEVVM
jgi:hypothetical protein